MKDDYEFWVRELYHWQYSREVFSSSFCQLLIILYRKADRGNKLRLAMGFPLLSLVMQDWEDASDDGNDLFRRYKLMPEAD